MQRSIHKSKRSTPKAAGSFAKTAQEKMIETNGLLRQLALVCDVIKPTFKLLTEARFLDFNTHPLRNLIQRLAFVYRFHSFILGLALLSKHGRDREQFYAIRNKLLHRININLLDEATLSRTRELLTVVSLDEINKLNATYKNIKGNEILAGIKKTPLYQILDAEPDHQGLAVSPRANWLEETAIPLLNYIWQPNKQLDYTDRREEYDASKMLIMVIGESCPSHINKKFSKHENLLRFIKACRKLRCDYSHMSLTHKLYDRIHELTDLGKKITTHIVDEKMDITKTIFPFIPRPALQQVQAHTNHSRPGAIP